MRRLALILICLFCAVVGWTVVGAAPQSAKSTAISDLPATQPATFTQLHGREGFWRIGQDVNGVWWFVSPSGQREFLNTVTTVQPFQLSRGEEGPDYVSRDLTGTVNDPGDLHHWALATIERVRQIGFKGLGA